MILQVNSLIKLKFYLLRFWCDWLAGREIIEPSSTEYLEALAAAPHPDPEPAPEGEEGEEAEEAAELDPQEGEEEGGAGEQTEEQARALTERDRDQPGLTQAGGSSYGNSSGMIIIGNLKNTTDISNSTNTTIVRVVITWADLDKEDIELSEEVSVRIGGAVRCANGYHPLLIVRMSLPANVMMTKSLAS